MLKEGPIAFLVDGENISAKLTSEMLAEAAKYGNISIRRIYGDWTSSGMNQWKPVAQEHAFVLVQQFANVAHKNATDSAMIIDAMEILHRGVAKGFCLVSSDSDYTRLAIHLRESGMFVMGIGDAKSPPTYRKAFDVFVTTENLKRPVQEGPEQPKVEARKAARHIVPREAVDLLMKAFEVVVREDGSALLSALGLALQRLDPAFDSRTYGFSRLLPLIEAVPNTFELEFEKEGTGTVTIRRKA